MYGEAAGRGLGRSSLTERARWGGRPLAFPLFSPGFWARQVEASRAAHRAAAWNDDTVDTVHLNLPNGLLSWRTGLLLPHDPAVPTTIGIPVAWDERATCAVIDAWMAQVFPADALPFVHEVIGYALYNGNPLHKAVLLHGTGRNGKGTFLRLLRALLGPANTTAVTPLTCPAFPDS